MFFIEFQFFLYQKLDIAFHEKFIINKLGVS